MRTYIAGPMRGYPEHNIPAFRLAAERLRSAGFDVVSPVEIGDAWAGGDQSAHAPEDYVRRDLDELLTCEAIALLPGWERSTGARCEAAVAVTLGFKFFNVGGQAIPAPTAIHIAGGYERGPGGAFESLDALRAESIAFANATFDRATQKSKATHLLKEARELLEAIEEEHGDLEEEMADVFLLLAHVSDGIDLAGAVRAKLEKNRRRKWGKPDQDGVVEHIEGAA